MLNRLHAPFLSVALLCSAITFAFAPGHMDADALGMLDGMRTGVYRDWYPLLLPALLKIFTVTEIGPTGVLAFQVLAIGSSTYAILAFFSPAPVAAMGTYIVLLCPAVLGYLGAITSHGILTAFLLCGYAALLYLSQPSSIDRRFVLFIVSFVALSAASIARVTAIAFTLPAFCIWVHLVIVEVRGLSQARKHRRLYGIAIAGVTLTVAVPAYGNSVLASVFHPIPTGPVQGIALYDISAISLRANRLLLDPQHFPDQNLERLRQAFVETNPDVLFFLGVPAPPVKIILSGDQTEVLRAWRGAIAMYPTYYLAVRWNMFRGLLGLDFRVPPVVPYHPGIDANGQGYQLFHPRADAVVVKYLTVFQSSFIGRPFVYLILLLLAVVTMRLVPLMTSESSLVLLAFSAGNLAFVGGHFVATPSTLLRYLWPSIVVCMVISCAVATAYVSLLLRREVPANAVDKKAIVPPHAADLQHQHDLPREHQI